MHSIRLICLMVLALRGLAAQEILREQLPSGLTLIVRENHLTPAVTMVLAVNAAPQYEGSLLGSGASELLRRLKSQTLPAHLAELVQRSGHRLSGHTTVAYTAYTMETTQEHIDSALQAFAGIAANRSYNQTAFERHRNALLTVQQHRDLSVDHQIDLSLHRAFYRQRSQAVSVSGESLPLQRLNLEELRRYDQERYVSGNMTLLVNGNISTDIIRKSVAQFFASVPQGFTADHLLTREAPMLASRSLNVEHGESDPELVLAWRTVSQKHSDQAIISFIAAYLNAANSPLRAALQSKQLAEAVSVEHKNTIGAPGYLQIRVRLRGEDTQQVMSVIGDALAQLQDSPLSVDQIAQIQKQLQREDLMSAQSTLEISEEMLRWEIEAGVPGYGEQMRAIRQRVKPQHIQKAALQYFRSSRSCKLTVKAPPIESTNPDVLVTPQATTTVPPRVKELENGVSIIERPLPMGLVHIVLSLGVDFSDDRRRGINELLSRMITLRTATRSSQDLKAMLAEKGMRLKTLNSSDSLQLQITCFPEDTLFAVGLLADCVTRPNFQEVELETYRQQLIEEIAGQERSHLWKHNLRQQVMNTLFADHYVSYSRFGNAGTLKDIDVKALHDHLRYLVHGPNVVVSIYGSYDEKKTASFLKQHLSNARLFPAGQRLQPRGAAWPAFKSLSGSISGDVDALAMVWRAPAIGDSLRDKVAMDVLVALIGGVNGRGGMMAELAKLQDRDPILDSSMETYEFDKRGLWLWLLRVDTLQSAAVRDLIATSIKKVMAGIESKKNAMTEQAIYRAKQICKTNHLLNDKNQGEAVLTHADIVLRESSLQSVTDYNAVLADIGLEDVRRVGNLYVKELAYILQMAPERAEEPKLEPVQKPVSDTPAKTPAKVEQVTEPVQAP